VQELPTFEDRNLLVGPEDFSDAGVYRLADGLAIVQSLDFFPPLVNDPLVFGRIAAANALGDLYAVGATPRTALNIVGFPDDELPLDVLDAILRGASTGSASPVSSIPPTCSRTGRRVRATRSS
jgi:selenide,water dikinase